MENNEIMNENEVYAETDEMNEEGLVIAEAEPRKIGLLDVVIVGSVAYAGCKVIKAGVKGIKKLCGKLFRKKKNEDDAIEDVEYVEVDETEVDPEEVDVVEAD